MSLSTGLVSYWKFDESSGNASDSVNSNTLSNIGSITYSAGLINNGANLASSSSQYFTASDSTSLSITGDASWSFWLKPGSPFGSTNDPVILCKLKNSGQYSYYVQINSSSNFVNFVVSSNGTSTGSATVTIPSFTAGTWYHIVVIYTASTGTFEVYTQGTSRGTGTGLPTSIYDGTDPFEIGRYSPGNSNFVNGEIDEVGIWSRVLTSTEVSDLYNSGTGVQYPFSTTYNQTVAAVASVVSGMSKTPGKLISATASANATMLKQMAKTLSVTGIGSASVIKQITKTIGAIATGAAGITASRAYILTMNAVATGVAAVTTSRAFLQTLAATATATASVSIKKTYAKAIAATAVGTATVNTAIVKTISAVAVGVAKIQTNIGRALSATAVGVARIGISFWKSKYSSQGDEYDVKYHHD